MISSITKLNRTIGTFNALTSFDVNKSVGGKISVSEDIFTPVENKTNIFAASVQNHLNEINNLAKDKNGSHSLFYARTKNSRDKKSEERKTLNIFA